MKRIILISVFFSVFVLSHASVSIADTLWATSVVGSSVGTGYIAPERSVTDNALGSPDDLFYSLGIGGWAIFEFENLFDWDAIIVETTYGARSNYVETADILVSLSSDLNSFQLVTSIDNASQMTSIDLSSLSGPFKYLMILDTTEIGGDGFDIDAVGVTPVPEPATMLLFGAGLIGLVATTIRKKKNSNRNI